MLASRLEDMPDRAAIIRRPDFNRITSFNPFAVEEKPLSTDGSGCHLCHGVRPPPGKDPLIIELFYKGWDKVTSVQISLLKLGELLRRKSLSPVELTEQCLARIERLNLTFNAFITVMADSALAQACQAEEEIRQGDWRGPLHGVPIGLKDIIDTAGVHTTAASALFKDRIPQEDAEVVVRLKKAGAVLIGKQNLHEFAYGGSSIISDYGEVRNPWNTAHITGGSSGGSAAAVATGLGYGAIGTDTAGSIREPAALSGIVGLKPTYGRVSARGVIPLSLSLDHVGPLARSVSDAAVIFQAIAGFDAKDSASMDVPMENYLPALEEKFEPLRIGVPRKFFYDDVDPEVASAMEHALSVLKASAKEVRDVELEVPTERKLQMGESYAYHAESAARTPELYQPETLRRIRAGDGIEQSEIAHQRQLLAKLRSEIGKVFENLDVLVTPTTPVPAPSIAELKQNPDALRERELLLLRNTRPFNVWGLPAISVPCGFTQAGLPVGLQIAGPHWQEARILQLAHVYEKATAWHKRQPIMK
jgi:aspartyl-tRNA(Asn)/glutamyl-tRNA(Gln) amidotransferase subunit A